MSPSYFQVHRFDLPAFTRFSLLRLIFWPPIRYEVPTAFRSRRPHPHFVICFRNSTPPLQSFSTLRSQFNPFTRSFHLSPHLPPSLFLSDFWFPLGAKPSLPGLFQFLRVQRAFLPLKLHPREKTLLINAVPHLVNCDALTFHQSSLAAFADSSKSTWRFASFIV